MSFRWRVAGVLGIVLFPVSWGIKPLLLTPSHAQAPPRTFSKSLVRLPVHIDERTRTELTELQLHVRGPKSGWLRVQTAPPSQTSFDYHAETDGEYSFMIVAVDKAGRKIPADLDSRPPHQVILVDSAKPELAIRALPVANHDIYLKCEMRDANPDFASIRMDYQGLDNQWHPLDLVQVDWPGVFRVPHKSVWEGKVRATAKDKAGNVGEAIVDLADQTQSLAAGANSTPAPLPQEVAEANSADPRAPQVSSTPMSTPPVPPTPPAPVPAAGALQTGYKNQPGSGTMPDIRFPDADAKNPPVSAYNPNRPGTEAMPDPVVIPQAPAVADPKSAESLKIASPPIDENLKKLTQGDPFMPKIDTLPVKPVVPPTDSMALPVKNEVIAGPPPLPSHSDYVAPEIKHFSPAATSQAGHRIINSTRCVLNYAIENVYVGGQPKMEFWATRDSGRSWSRVQDESGGRSPARLTLPGDGLYGIRVKANGTGLPPQPGEAPDAWVEVDTVTPTVRLLPPVIGEGAEAGTLTIRWIAHDPNLAPDSINIFQAVRPEGPWLPIAKGVQNEGTYRWLIPAGIGAEVYLRIEAADRAGNVGRGEWRDPIPMPQPKVKVISIDRAP